MTSIDQTIEKLQGVLSVEREQTHINGLDAITASKLRRAEIKEYMGVIEAELQPIRQAIKDLPALPVEEQIQWAQAISAMRISDGVRFLEIDTTGLSNQDGIVRVAMVNLSGGVMYDDILIKPSRPISREASAANGLTDDDVKDAPSLPEVWERIQSGLYGRYVISFNQKFDVEKLNEAAARHQLPPILIIGDDLQRHCTQYYHKEYYLTLEAMCERIGHPIQGKSAVDRAIEQYHLLLAMANGITDVRPPRPAAPTASSSAASNLGDDGLEDLDAHPF
jgi:DNA polymerase III epsilon subunit-like protein